MAGIQTMLVNIVNRQADSGHDVTIAILHDEVNASLLGKINDKVKYVQFGKGIKKHNPLSIIRLNWFLSFHHFDILHIHNPRLIRLIKVPINVNKICSTQHCLCNGALDSDYNCRIQNRFAISDAVRDDIMKRYDLPSVTVPNGINIAEFKISDSVYKIGNKLRIVQVGRLNTSVKGQDLLIKALAILSKKGLSLIEVDFIGADQNNGLDELQQLAYENGLHEKVHFLGLKEQSFLAQHLCDYDLFVLASRNEGFGLCIAEAFSAKVPVLVSDVTGPMEVIDKGRCGYYFKQGDANSLANQLENIIKNGVNWQIIELAYERACKYYDVRCTSDTYINLYKKMVKHESIYDSEKSSYALIDYACMGGGKITDYLQLKSWIKTDYESYKMKHHYAARLTYGENWELFAYMRNLRYLEYYTNKKKKPIDNVLRFYYWLKHRKNCKKTGIFIMPNSVGPGFHLQHRGFRHILPGSHIGANCEILPMVLMGKKTKGLEEASIVVGDNCYIGVGVTILGPVTIGNNVIIAAGAVVTKDIPDNAVVAGVPAKIKKIKE